MATASPDRGQWGSSLGFVLAAVGSAVGLGNMWRFSYLTAEHGGAAFVILYILMILLVALPIMLAEFVVGRGAKQSPVQALVRLGGNGWRPLGYLFVASGLLILAYYGVIAGWVVRYTWIAVVEGFGPGAAERFEEIAVGWDAVALQVVFMAITIAVVAGGIRGGIERASVFLMPLLFAIVVGIALYAATLQGATEGYRNYLIPDFDAFFNMEVLAAAASQAFFSLSLGMGALLTYASYLTKDDNLPRESAVISVVDFGVAFVAGLMIFPIIFALGLSEVVGESTVGTLFISLPGAFAEMGTAGRVVGIAFFVALLVGALTSAISLLEVVVSTSIDGLRWTRTKAAIIGGVLITIIGIPAALNLNWLTIYDSITGKVFLVLGGLLISVFVGWRMKDPEGEAGRGARVIGWLPVWKVWLRFVIPVVLALILLKTVPAGFVEIRDAVRSLAAPTEEVDDAAPRDDLDDAPVFEGAAPPVDELPAVDGEADVN
jgi:neurotransmitter:Na+ symporter, NSS family